ncbi:MAG: FixH family protein [Myxococcales bacterium]|nr:FixH family protein [Myxococcales bacterium]
MISRNAEKVLILRGRVLILACAALVVAWAGTACSDSHDPVDTTDSKIAPETTLEGISTGGRYFIRIAPAPAMPEVGALFTLTTEVFAADMATPATVTTAQIDGWMPKHKHGMEGVSPKTVAKKTGLLETQGLLFNMPGQWQFRIKVTAGAHGTDELTLPFYVSH